MIQLVLHHAAKDLRAVRPWLALWLALLLVNFVAMVPAVDLAARQDDAVLGLTVWTYLLAVLRVALGMLIVVRVVHADPPAGTTAFWLTRPLPSRAVLCAKLLVLGGLVGASAAANLAGLLLNALEPAMVPVALAEIALFEAIPLLALAVVASLTRDTARLVLAGLACLLPYLAGRVITVNMTADGLDAHVGPGVLPLELIVVAFSLLCLSVQYLARRARRTLGLAGVGLALIAVVGSVAPLQRDRAAVTTPWPGAASVSARLTPDSPQGPAATLNVRQSRRIHANLELQGVAAGVVVRVQSVDGRLRFPDGHEVQFRQDLGWGTYTITGESGRDAQVTAAAAHALGAEVFHAEDQHGWYMRIPLAKTDTPEVMARKGMPGRYEATVTLVAHRLRLAGVLSRRPGSHIRTGSQGLTILERRRNDSMDMLRVRLAKAALLWERTPALEFLLVNRSRAEALPGYYNQRSARLEPLSPFYLWAPLSTVSFVKALLENRGLDDTWFEGSELALLTIEEEGTFTKQVTMDEVTLR
ncbi:MAG: hypothetical protein EHM24_14335 [Acidobacteria bacterium]|nr:MAG: hypothetical protein EHM24_14335 [Acidobacteriota bacterium]